MTERKNERMGKQEIKIGEVLALLTEFCEEKLSVNYPEASLVKTESNHKQNVCGVYFNIGTERYAIRFKKV